MSLSVCKSGFRCYTLVTVVIDENDLPQEPVGGGLQHAMHGPQQRRPRLVVEGDHHRRGWQLSVVILHILATMLKGCKYIQK